MTVEEIRALNADEIETRLSEIRKEMETDGVDLKALKAEVDAIEERKAEIKTEIEARKAIADKVANGEGVVITEKKEERTMSNLEVRNTKEYIDAFANYIKTGKDAECRALLTENVSGGTVPVPEFVEGVIRTAWDNDEIMGLVNRTSLKGNVKVGFERSASDAAIHTEGAAAPDEESLLLGIVTMVPETIKKWITISDEVIDMNGEAFVTYIYNEIAHKIIKKAADTVVADITALSTTATATAPAVTNVTASGIADFVNAVATLSDEASNPVIIMHKQSYAYYKGLAISANYAIDPFDGMKVVFNNTLKVAGTSGTGNVAIVGDLGNGYMANFPDGFEPTFKYDDLSLAEKDLVKVVGRLPIGHGVVASGHFAIVKKTA